jgi:DNA-binding NarL/FixJ family response regulator
MTTINVLIADDHGVLRGGIRSLLKAEPDMQVVGEAGDGVDALRLAAELSPNVLLADISMPPPTGIEVAQQLRQTHPAIHVLVLTMHEDVMLVQEALRVGAAGYIIKRAVESELINAIRTVAAGQTYVYESLRYVAPAPAVPTGVSQDHEASLNEAETNALRLIASGHTTLQVAALLCCTPEIADTLRVNLLKKLGLRSRLDLAKYAREHGLLE